LRFIAHWFGVRIHLQPWNPTARWQSIWADAFRHILKVNRLVIDGLRCIWMGIEMVRPE
jgi:hypothetical protein